MARTARSARIRLIRGVIGTVGATLALTLSGCAAGQIAQTAQQVAAVDGANATAGQIGIRDVRLASTTDGSYTAGSDVPVRLWVSNDGTTPDTLSSVTSPVSDSVEIGGDAAEFAGRTLVQIGDDSAITVTLTAVKDELRYGHSVPITFTFANAGALTVNVPIEIPAQREEDGRATVNNLPEEHGNVWFGEEGESSESGEAGH